MYLIFWQESMYHSSIPASSIVFLCSAHVTGSLDAFPLRTNSIILNAFIGFIPLYIKYTIISSRQPITSLNGTFILPFSSGVHKSLALPNHTSVPWESPDILTSSAKVVGLVSATIPIVNGVPNSGIPRVPVGHIICSFVTPSTLVLVNILIVSLSSSGTSSTLVWLKSWISLSCVGSECPKISSLSRFSSIEW